MYALAHDRFGTWQFGDVDLALKLTFQVEGN
jgi:hypothetical protein